MVNVTNNKGDVSVQASGEILDLAAKMSGIVIAMMDSFKENSPDEMFVYAMVSEFRDSIDSWIEENASEKMKKLWHMHTGMRMN